MGKKRRRRKAAKQEQIELKQVSLEDSRDETLFYTSQRRAGAGDSRATAKLLQAYSHSPWLRAVVHKIASSFAGIEWTVGVPTVNGSSVRRPGLQRSPNRNKTIRLKTEKSLELVDLPGHPMLELLEFGNPCLDGYSVAQLQQSYMELKGEFFTAKQRNPAGMPVALWPMAPSWVQEIPSGEKPFYVVSVNGQQQSFAPEDIIWGKDPDPLSPYGRGTGTGQSLADEIDSDEYAAAFIKAFFYNSAVPDALIGFDGASIESVRQAEYRWNQEHRGPSSAHRIRFFNKKPEVIKLGQEFKDTSVVNLRRFERDTIHQVFGVPPEILGIIESSNRATIDAAEAIFGRWVLEPRAERQRIVYQNQLAPDFDDRLVVGYISPVPSDKEHELNVMKAASWAATRNEWRERMNLERQDDVDEVYLQPNNLIERPAEGFEDDEELEAELIDQTRALAPRAKALDRAAIDRLVEEGFQVVPIQAETVPVMESGMDKWASRMLKRHNIGAAFDKFNPRILQHVLDYSSNKITRVNETSKQFAREAVAEGVSRGEGAKDIAKRLRPVFNQWNSRALTIARTEALRSSNFVSEEVFRQSGAFEGKRWVTTIDGRERDAHRGMQFQLRSIDKPFNAPPAFGGYPAMRPGDFGRPELDINCRCTMIPVVDIAEAQGRAPSRIVCKGMAEEDEVARTEWQVKLALAWRRAFRKQFRAILEILEQVDR